jgi:hypothetical protein
MAHGIKGPNLTVAGRSNLSIHVFRRARQLLAARRVHTVFAGFSECVPYQEGGPSGLREWACIFSLERADRVRQRGATGGLALAEIELAPPEPPTRFSPGRALRLPLPLPQPLSPAALAAAEPVDLELADPLGTGPEHLPLIQAGRLKATHVREENAYVAFPVVTRTGISLLGVAWV